MFAYVRARTSVGTLCHIPPETLGNTVTYGDTPTHIDVAEVVDRNCVGGIWCASARAARIDFQACTLGRSVISPLESITYGFWIKPKQFVPRIVP